MSTCVYEVKIIHKGAISQWLISNANGANKYVKI